jgi:hypothetical protein
MWRPIHSPTTASPTLTFVDDRSAGAKASRLRHRTRVEAAPLPDHLTFVDDRSDLRGRSAVERPA